MGFNRFSILLAMRMLLIMSILIGLSFFVIEEGYHAATLLAALLAIALTWEMTRFVAKTNMEVTRFLEAARYADFGQRFNLEKMGAGFSELGDTFTDILQRFRDYRGMQESELRHLKALVEHVPVPLISVHSDEHLEVWNNAARRLFGTTRITRITDLSQFGDEFAEQIAAAGAGDKFLAPFVVDNMQRQLTVAVSQLMIAGRAEKLISLQDIQSELDYTQLDAWQDLVRVLTHEIMNSITPVASLSRTAVDLVDDAMRKVADDPRLVEELTDVKDAVNTVASRSDGLMKFVGSYRRLTRLPPPERSRFPVRELFDDVIKLACQDWDKQQLTLVSSIEPENLDLYADRNMLEQVLINIVQNSEHALAENEAGQVLLQAYLNKRGHVTLEVSDNGPGIDEQLSHKIFVPFYTTKRDGSGVGLALSRQVMIAHGGTIAVTRSAQGGARFTLIF